MSFADAVQGDDKKKKDSNESPESKLSLDRKALLAHTSALKIRPSLRSLYRRETARPNHTEYWYYQFGLWPTTNSLESFLFRLWVFREHPWSEHPWTPGWRTFDPSVPYKNNFYLMPDFSYSGLANFIFEDTFLYNHMWIALMRDFIYMDVFYNLSWP